MEFLIMVPLNYVTIQKSRSKTMVIVTSTSFMESQHIVAWNFHLLECFVKIDASIAGVPWNFIAP
jgi:hypothetical protein